MKKRLAFLFVLLTASLAVACSPTAAIVANFDDDDIYALSAIGATELLKQTIALSSTPVATSETTPLPTLLADTVGGATTTPEEPIVGTDLETVNKYLNMIESYLGDDSGLSFTTGISDRVGYAYMIVYTFNDILGEAKTITIYFNLSGDALPDDGTPDTTTTMSGQTTTGETTTTAEVTTTMITTATTAAPTTTVPVTTATTTTISTDGAGGATPHGAPRPRTKVDATLEGSLPIVVSHIVGLIVYENVEYPFEGEKTIEDGEENYRLRAVIDDLNFVRVSYKTDEADGERKFFHEIVIDGIVVESSKTKIEIDADGIKAELEFIAGSATGKYHFTIETVGAITEIVVAYETMSAEGVVEKGAIRITGTYDELTGATDYVYVVIPEGGVEAHYEGDRGDHHDEGFHYGHDEDLPDDENDDDDEFEDEDEVEDEDELEDEDEFEDEDEDEFEDEDELEDEDESEDDDAEDKDADVDAEGSATV